MSADQFDSFCWFHAIPMFGLCFQDFSNEKQSLVPQATLANLGDLPTKSCPGTDLDRLLYGSYATFRLLFVFVVLPRDRRQLLHFGVTSHPTAEWTARQLVQAFPWIARHATCCAIATEFMASRSRQPSIRWRFTRCSPLLNPRGKMLIADYDHTVRSPMPKSSKLP
jgi:hypothetical protein